MTLNASWTRFLNKYFNVDTLIGITIALLPLYIRIDSQLETNRLSKDFLFLYLILGFVAFLSGSMKSKYVRHSIIGFIALAIVNQYRPFSNNVTAQTVFIISGLIFFLKYFEYDGKRNTQRIYDGMIAGALIQGVFAIFGYFGHHIYLYVIQAAKIRPYFYYSIAKNRWTLDYMIEKINVNGAVSGVHGTLGSFGNINLTASYLCMTIPAFLSRKRVRYLVIIPIIALLLNQSIMGVGALIAGVIYYSGVLSKIKMYTLTILGMLIFPFLNLNIDSGRVDLWRRIVKSASIKHWLVGMGPGWFPDIQFSMGGNYYAAQEHNVFLSIFNIYGLLGFAILFPIFYKFLKQKKDDRILSTILFIIFCNAYGHFSFHQSTVLIIIIPILALNLERGENK